MICDHLSPKNLLDKMRYICKGKTQPIPELYRSFNKETRDGKNMSEYSYLLGETISSIIETKNESDIDSFLSGGNISFLADEIKGINDFELICFLVIRNNTHQNPYRVIVAGSRDFNDYDKLSNEFTLMISMKKEK